MVVNLGCGKFWFGMGLSGSGFIPNSPSVSDLQAAALHCV